MWFFFSNFKYMSIFIHTAYIKRYRNANYNIFLNRSKYNCYICIYILHSVFTLPCNESDALTEFPKVLCFKK